MNKLAIAAYTLGLMVAVPVQASVTLTFQQGANAYVGTQDTELWGGSPTTPLGLTEQSISIDANNGGEASQALIRFDGILGAGPGQIAPGSQVVNALLTLQITSEGSGLHVHDMLVDWSQSSATWDSMGGGVKADGTQAAANEILHLGQNNGSKNVTFPSITLDLTSSVQKLVDGQLPGYGWALLPFMPNGTNGVDFASSEAIGIANRPLLTVTVNPVPEPQTWALWLAGMAAVVGRVARRHGR